MQAEEVVKAIVENPKALRMLAGAMISDPEVRLVLLEGVIREVATKQDLRDLRAELVSYIDARVGDLHRRIDDLNRRVDDLHERIEDLGRMIEDLSALVRASLVAIVVTLASTILVPLLLKTLLP